MNKMLRARLFQTVLVAFAFGCDEGEDRPSGDEAEAEPASVGPSLKRQVLARGELCGGDFGRALVAGRRILALAECERAVQCDGSAAAAWRRPDGTQDLEACADATVEDDGRVLLPLHLSAIAAGLITIDPARYDECAEDSREAEYGQYAGCAAAVVEHGSEGTPCLPMMPASEDGCGLGTFCPFDYDGDGRFSDDFPATSTCAAQAAPGGACLDDESCALDLVCFDGRCDERRAEGEICESSTTPVAGNPCAADLICPSIDLTPLGERRCQTEVDGAAPGDSCEFEGRWCDGHEPLLCRRSSNEHGALVCHRQGRHGEACELVRGVDTCDSGLVCRLDTSGSAGECVVPEAPLSECHVFLQCPEYHICYDGECRRIDREINGARCKLDDDCASRFCEAGTCQPMGSICRVASEQSQTY
jgi:hypothetical protein